MNESNEQILAQQIVALRAQLALCVAALAFYSDRGNYEPRTDAHGHRQRPIMVYKWMKAAEALREFPHAPAAAADLAAMTQRAEQAEAKLAAVPVATLRYLESEQPIIADDPNGPKWCEVDEWLRTLEQQEAQP